MRVVVNQFMSLRGAGARRTTGGHRRRLRARWMVDPVLRRRGQGCAAIGEGMSKVAALLFGRRSCREWPLRGPTGPRLYADQMNVLPNTSRDERPLRTS